MSTTDRKIGYYSWYFWNVEEYNKDPDADHEQIADEKLLDDLFNSILSLIQSDRTENIKRSNKIHYLDYYEKDALKGNYLAYGYFVSGKYNHSPDLISVDGGRRKSDKGQNEAEEERTHFAIMKTVDEFCVLLEERQVGVGMGRIKGYLNKYHKTWCAINKKKQRFVLNYEVIPSEPFLQALASITKINLGTIYINKERVASDFLKLAEQDVKRIRDDVEITIKSNTKEFLLQAMFKKLHNKKMQGIYKRIRLKGKTVDGSPITLDTDKAKQVKYVTAELNPNGTVNSESIFDAFREILIGMRVDQEE